MPRRNAARAALIARLRQAASEQAASAAVASLSSETAGQPARIARSNGSCAESLRQARTTAFAAASDPLSAALTSTLPGLRSRWMIPFWCACCTAWQTGMNSSSRSRGVSRRSSQ